MKETERIKRINDAINKHYKSNSVKIIHFSGACMIYTRESIKGYFKK